MPTTTDSEKRNQGKEENNMGIFPVLLAPNIDDIVYLHAVARREVSVHKLVQGEILHAAPHLHAKV